MSNEHHQSGRRPDKADLARLHPDHHDKQPLKQGSSEEQHRHPNEKSRKHSHNGETLLDEIQRLDSDD